MRREEGGGSASPVSAEGAFLGAMRLRDAWMSHGAKQVRDESAKEETIASAAAGREHPAVAAYHNGRCSLSRPFRPATCRLCAS